LNEGVYLREFAGVVKLIGLKAGKSQLALLIQYENAVIAPVSGTGI
jgi:hypothetical protein